MSDREARGFLDAICANPADDTARLVYADWLEERGNAPRAEFIRTQIARAALPAWDARHVRLLMRERVLLAAHEREWRAELPGIARVTWGEFRRGFVATAAFDVFEAFRQGGPACWAIAPVEAVEIPWPNTPDLSKDITSGPGLRELFIGNWVRFELEVARFAAWPVLSTIRTLNIPGMRHLGMAEFRQLVSSPHLQNLAALRMPDNRLGNGVGGTLNGTNFLPALTELDLSAEGHSGDGGPRITSGGVTTLTCWSGLARLRTLNLSGNNIQRDGLRSLLRSPNSAGLKHLNLRNTGLTSASMKEFGAAHPGLQLETLDLGDNQLWNAGVGHLAEAACLRDLKKLGLDRCGLEVFAVPKLVTTRFFRRLRVLDVGYNKLGPEGVASLLRAHPSELHTLDLSGCDVGAAGVAGLARSPASDALLDVNLAHNGLGDDAAQALAGSAHLRNLLALRLSINPLSQRAIAALANSPLGKRLAVLEWPQAAGDDAGEDDLIPF